MDDRQQAHADLAFMKSLVEEGERSQLTSGSAFLAAGLLYGVQCLVQWAQIVGLTRFSDGLMLAFVVSVTVAFLAVLGVLIWRDRKVVQRGVGTRALGAAFAGVGLANLVLCSVFGLLAWRRQDMGIWLLYPVALCAVMGAGWYVAAAMRRRLWLGLVSAGWFLTGVGLGLLISAEDLASYVLLIGAALLLLLALPGGVMVRSAKTPG